MSDPGYSNILDPNNFTNIANAITPASGVYNLTVDFLTTSAEASDVIWNGSAYYSSTQFASLAQTLPGQIIAGYQAIMEISSTSAYSDYFSDIANVTFSQPTANPITGLTPAAIAIGDISNTSPGPLFQGGASDYLSLSLNFAHTSTLSTFKNALFGDIWFNNNTTQITDGWAAADTPGSLEFATVLHELALSLGEKEPASGSGETANYTVALTDDRQISGLTHVAVSGLQIDDIEAIQSIYGANYSERSGNTVYGYGDGFAPLVVGTTPTAGEFIYTIWDGGGINVIDASSYAGPSLVNLNEGAFSSIGPADTGYASNNVAIAYGAIIQNAIGTQGGTTFIGNLWNNVLAGGGAGANNTFYSDQLVSPLDAAGSDWSHNGNSSTVGTQWTDTNYTPVPTLKDDVLIGDGGVNVFFSGKANNVIDGGYFQTDIDNATSAISSNWGNPSNSNYWDAAHQFTADPTTHLTNSVSGSALGNAADLNAVPGNTVNYEYLARDDSAIQSTTPGITVSYSGTDLSNNPEMTVLKGATGSDGEDILIDVQTIVDSTGENTFLITGAQNIPLFIDGINGVTGPSHYIFTMGADSPYGVAAVSINDPTGLGTVVIQDGPGLPVQHITLSSLGTNVSGFSPTDSIINIVAQSGSTEVSINVDYTAMGLGSGIKTFDIGGYNIDGGQFASAIANDLIPFSSITPAALYADVYNGVVYTPPVLPAPVYDSSDGSVTGMLAPSYTSGGSYMDLALGQEIDHPWVATSFGTSGSNNTATVTTTPEAVNMIESSSDIRLAYSGHTSDTLTVYAVAEGESFTISNLTQGTPVSGVGTFDSAGLFALGEPIELLCLATGEYYLEYPSSVTIPTSTVSAAQYFEQMTFSDGVTWDMQSGGLTFTAALASQTLYSRDGYDDTLVAAYNYDTLNGSTGNTTMIAGVGSTINNGTGTDVDVFSAGTAPVSVGGDTINLNTSGGTAAIAFHGIDPSAVTMWDNSYGELIVQFSSTDQITVSGGTLDSTGFTLGSLTQINFDDTGHTTWDTTGGLTLTAASADQTIYGTSGGGDTLIAEGNFDILNGYGGTETLIAGPGATLNNGNGTDTDVFSAGTAAISLGGDVITENASGGTATIAFHGIDPSAVTMWDNSYGELIVQFSSTDQIAVNGGTLDSTGFTLGSLTHITFDDTGHTTWDTTGGLTLTAASADQTIYGTSGGGDTLVAVGNYDNLYAYGGVETLVAGPGASLYNGTGNDVDVINSGSSPSSISATIYANASGGSDNVVQMHDVISTDIKMWDDTYGDLTVATPTDQFVIAGGSYSGTTGFAMGNIDHIALDDSSTIALQGGLNLTAINDSQSIYGTGHGDSLTAAGNNDSLYGIAGNNTMAGDADSTYFYGGSGNDMMVAGSGTNYMTMGTGNDEIKIEGSSSTTAVTGFDASHDTIHLEDVMSGFDALTDALSNWVQKTESGGNTVIAVDQTGSGSFTAGPQVTLNSVTGLDDIATLVAHGVVHV